MDKGHASIQKMEENPCRHLPLYQKPVWVRNLVSVLAKPVISYVVLGRSALLPETMSKKRPWLGSF